MSLKDFCAWKECGELLTEEQLAKGQRFHSRACFAAYRKAHPELYQAQREATAKANRERWEEWKATGHDPAHGGPAAAKRSAKITQSNRDAPRRAKRAT